MEGFFAAEDLHDIPATGWRPPDLSDLPDRLAGPIGFDLETRDEGLAAGAGAGWAWEGGGEVVGYAIAADNLDPVYLPIGHKGGGNVDPGRVRRWLTHVLSDDAQPKVGANIMYDVGWAQRDGVHVAGPYYDVQWAEALLDEHRRSYALDGLARDYVGEGKQEAALQAYAAACGYDAKGELWRMPADRVGPYAEADAALPRAIRAAQLPRLAGEGLGDLCALEHALLPLYVDMRWRGVRVDADRAEQIKAEFATEIETLKAEIQRRTGVAIDPWAAASIVPALEAEGLAYGKTKTGMPSITRQWLETTDHWLTRAVARIRELDKLCGTFIDGHILGHMRNGRIHGETHPLRGDDGGTVTGRLSMSNPNLQQIPQRTETGRRLRALFLPEEGDRWYKADFSQQEPRLLVHFASKTRIRGAPIPGIDRALAFYRDNEDADFYVFLQEIAGLSRAESKTLTLARIYGRGVRSTAKQLGVSRDEAQAIFDKLDQEAPFIKAMGEAAKAKVHREGYVKSLFGRRSRFELWEPKAYDKRDGMLPRAEAEARWGADKITRARAHKALNSIIQPSAADQTKRAMLDVYEAGLGHRLLLQVHDELDLSTDDPAEAQRVAGIMENAVPLAVPMKVDLASGDNWGEVE